MKTTKRPSHEHHEAITWKPRSNHVKTTKRPFRGNHVVNTRRHLRENSKEAISLKPHGDTTRYSRENNKEAISWKPWGEYHEAFTWKQQRGHLIKPQGDKHYRHSRENNKEAISWKPRGGYHEAVMCRLTRVVCPGHVCCQRVMSAIRCPVCFVYCCCCSSSVLGISAVM